MNCDKFKELILDSILEESDSPDSMELQKHIRTCSACRIEFEQIQSAVRTLKPGAGEELSLVEKLRIENKIYEARLKRLSGKRFRNTWIKRLTAIAAAVFFFFLGYSIRTTLPGNRPIKDRASYKESIEERMNLQFARIYGQRISPRGLLLIAKGEKALEEYKLRK
ncbi:MAG: hypothetical protein JXA73_20485 [Acidobacteria bacterium]|nr:hypothetical protein [Acidobacteriota bacterium]